MTTTTNNERINKAAELLEQGVRNVFTEGHYEEYLKWQNAFHTYSVNNQILIFLQRPDATHVAGFKTWATKMGRHVMKGEKAITILAPVPHVQTIDKDKEGNPLPPDEVKTIKWNTYKPVSVFDVSQTDGKPVPEAPKCDMRLEGNVADYHDIITALINGVSPAPVAFADITDGANGYFSPAENRIVIKTGMPELETVATLIHEIAHAIMHKASAEDTRTKEVQAESVSYIVCNTLGLDTSACTFGYVASWAGNKEVKQLVKSMEVIKKTAADILAAL